MLAPEAEAAAAVPHGRPVSLHSLSGCFLVCGGSDFWAHAVWKSHQEVLAFILSTVSAALAARVAEIARPFRRLKALLLGPGGGRASCGPARTPPAPRLPALEEPAVAPSPLPLLGISVQVTAPDSETHARVLFSPSNPPKLPIPSAAQPAEGPRAAPPKAS